MLRLGQQQSGNPHPLGGRSVPQQARRLSLIAAEAEPVRRSIHERSLRAAASRPEAPLMELSAAPAPASAAMSESRLACCGIRPTAQRVRIAGLFLAGLSTARPNRSSRHLRTAGNGSPGHVYTPSIC